jgi:hypothetical protein
MNFGLDLSLHLLLIGPTSPHHVTKSWISYCHTKVFPAFHSEQFILVIVLRMHTTIRSSGTPMLAIRWNQHNSLILMKSKIIQVWDCDRRRRLCQFCVEISCKALNSERPKSGFSVNLRVLQNTDKFAEAFLAVCLCASDNQLEKREIRHSFHSPRAWILLSRGLCSLR